MYYSSSLHILIFTDHYQYLYSPEIGSMKNLTEVKLINILVELLCICVLLFSFTRTWTVN